MMKDAKEILDEAVESVLIFSSQIRSELINRFFVYALQVAPEHLVTNAIKIESLEGGGCLIQVRPEFSDH